MAASRRDGIDPIHQYIYSYAAIFFIAKQALGETTAATYTYRLPRRHATFY
jgi:hypothetical protein